MAGVSPFPYPVTGALDAIAPVLHHGVWQLFANREGELVRYTSTNLVNWAPAEIRFVGPDEMPWFGPGSQLSLVSQEGRWQLFWGGDGRICLATSDDLRHWTVHRGNPVLTADPVLYPEAELNDPSVCFCREDGLWWLLANASKASPLAAQGGCIALAKSADLHTWTWYPPLWGPGLDRACGSPQLLPHHGRWYLFYRDGETLYRVANDAPGPYRRPPLHELYADGVSGGTRAVAHNDRWITFPRLAVAEGNDATGLPLVPRELVVQLDGSLTERPAEPVLAALERLPAEPQPMATAEQITGAWQHPRQDVARCVDELGGFIRFPSVAGNYYLEADLLVERQDVDITVHIGCDEAGHSLARLHLSPRMARAALTIDRGSKSTPDTQRWLPVGVNKLIHLQLFVYDDVVDAFVDERITLSGRLRKAADGAFAVGFRDGKAKVGQMTMRRLS